MALSHNLDHGDCPLCESKLKEAHPFFRELWPKLKSQFPLIHVSCTFRGPTDQDLMFKEGRSKLHWPNSRHNQMNSEKQPCSRAIDVFIIDEDGMARFPPKQYLLIYEWFKKNDYLVTWGGTFKGFFDGPHFELKDEVTQP